VIRADYALEYGDDSIEIQRDFVIPNQRYLIIDDVLATGGTAQAVAKCISTGGGTVAGYAFLIELGFLGGRESIKRGDYQSEITSLLTL
jgi:adenine phosphoribosyltransferase